jgi:large subunit ribosomal protein L29
VNPSELRDKPVAELEKMSLELKEEAFRLRFRHGTGQLKQTANIRKAKKDLARVATELTARAKTGVAAARSPRAEVKKGAAAR